MIDIFANAFRIATRTRAPLPPEEQARLLRERRRADMHRWVPPALWKRFED